MWWPAEQALEGEIKKKWTPPADNCQYLLLRLACTLHPPASQRTRYTEATFGAYLSAKNSDQAIIAHDLYPTRLAVDAKQKFTIGLTPEVKFAETVEAKLGEVGAEIEYAKAFPVIQGFGLGESHPYWRFAHHAANPLLGSQCVYVVIAAPKNVDGIQLSLELIATLETRFGIIPLGLPKEAQTYVLKTIA